VITLYKAYTSIPKFNRSRYENYRRPSSVNPTEHYSHPVPGNIAKKFGCEKLTGFLNHKKCVAGLEHFEIPKQVIKILENDAI
jgi:hypothetical protein